MNSYDKSSKGFTMLFTRVAVFIFSVSILASCKNLGTGNNESGQTDPSPRTKARTVSLASVDGNKGFRLQMTATSQVSDAWIDYLIANIQVIPVDPQSQDKSIDFRREQVAQLNYDYPEIKISLTVPEKLQKKDSTFIIMWPEVYTAVAPGIIRLIRPYDNGPPPKSDNDVGAVSTALTEGDFIEINGTLICAITDLDGPSSEPLPFASVIFDGEDPVRADVNGVFRLTGSFADPGSMDLVVRFLSDIPDAAGTFTTRLEIMDEFQHSRNTSVNISTTAMGNVLSLGNVTITHPDCDLWNSGVDILTNYHAAHGNSPPANQLRFKRWSDINVGTPHTYYDYIVLTKDYVKDTTSQARRRTLYHEFGHSIRHVADGPQHHWDWDDFRFAYARNHDINQITNEQFTFNEGFGHYYRIEESGIGLGMPVLDPVYEVGTVTALNDFLDWNEALVGHYLKRMSDAVTTTPNGVVTMVNILRSNPGTIHRLWDFEQAYCRVEPASNPFCGTSMRAAPDACPPKYNNDGATCRLPDVLAKDSYGRGAGIIPTVCSAGRTNDGGLCYPACRPGFDGFATLCIRDCRPGYHDDGLSCRRDVQIIASDNSACPWWDLCGLTTNRGCSTCPAGFQNDGCTCRIDADIYFKESYDRGVGTIPNRCAGGRQYQNGLCYDQCRAGFSGEGPVCWGACPVGYRDDGWTCWHEPHIFGRF